MKEVVGPGESAFASRTLSDTIDLAVVQREVASVGCLTSLSRLLVPGNIRDGTRRDRFDTYGAGKLKTGREGKMINFVVYWVGRYRTVGVKFLDETVSYSTISFFFMTERDGKKVI